jgi:hypothetical protein
MGSASFRRRDGTVPRIAMTLPTSADQRSTHQIIDNALNTEETDVTLLASPAVAERSPEVLVANSSQLQNNRDWNTCHSTTAPCP